MTKFSDSKAQRGLEQGEWYHWGEDCMGQSDELENHICDNYKREIQKMKHGEWHSIAGDEHLIISISNLD